MLRILQDQDRSTHGTTRTLSKQSRYVLVVLVVSTAVPRRFE